jgi:hypothetical protein
MAPNAPTRSNFFARCNYDATAPREPNPTSLTREQSAHLATDALLGLTEQAIARIEQRDDGEAALRELWASLLEIRTLRASDPGIRMAAQDLYEAAAALVIQSRPGITVVDMRRWRLLKQAGLRLRLRLHDGA